MNVMNDMWYEIEMSYNLAKVHLYEISVSYLCINELYF